MVAVVETGWAKDQLRALIVRQANQYLDATLEIGGLEGSLVRGIELHDVKLSREGREIVAIDGISLSYSPRELYQNGTVIRRIVIAGLRVVGSKRPDGRWDLASLVRRDARQRERTGPGRPIEIQSIELLDASVTLRDPLQFGAAHVPTEFRALNATFSFAYAPVRWTVNFERMSWEGRAPDLTVSAMTGTMGRGAEGWVFDDFSVQTPRSAFTLDGRILIGDAPTELDLAVRAPRLAFQEWSGIMTGLKNIAVEAGFDTTLKGPLTALDTTLALKGTGGSVAGRLTLNTRVPGWHGAGAVDAEHINLARWLNRTDRPSDITGRLIFDLDLDLGRKFPRGTYSFDGAHAMYMDYAADNLRARGRLVPGEAIVEQLDAVAYGATIAATTGTIGLDNPYPYHFQGRMTGLDLRRVPEDVPVPHVESVLALEYDAVGQFSRPFITASGRFAQSSFLGATIGAGTFGSIDTAVAPVHYTGEGEIADVDLPRFGRDLDVGWLRDPRYAGTVTGRFRVEGAGSNTESLALTASGRFSRATLFHGVLSDADATLAIDRGTLTGTFNGRIESVDPAVAFDDPRLAASLTGTANLRATVRDLLIRDVGLADYDVGGRMTLAGAAARGIAIDSGTLDAALRDSRLTVGQLEVAGPALAGSGSGVVAFAVGESNFSYDVERADLAQLQPLLGARVSGQAIASGTLTGPPSARKLAGEATLSRVSAYGVSALTIAGHYDATLAASAATAQGSATAARPTGQFTGRATFLAVAGQPIEEVSGAVTLANDRLGFNLDVAQTARRKGQLTGELGLALDRQAVDLLSLSVTLGATPWRLLGAEPPPRVSWTSAGIAVTPTVFASGHDDDQRVEVNGTWLYDGGGALTVTARHAFLESLQNTDAGPPRFGGVVDLDAVIGGSRAAPSVTGTVTISNGRIERVTYERLAGRIDYRANLLDIDLRLDQSAATWMTARGKVPRALFDESAPDSPLDVAIESSSVDLGLLEGLTDVVTRTVGRMHVNLRAVGTGRDPHFEGAIDVADAGFLVQSTGVRYKNGRAAFRFAADRIAVESFHIEDDAGQPLELRGSLGTRVLQVGDLSIDITANRFEVLRNEFGRLAVNATLALRGRFEAPRMTGEIAINAGNLAVDQILDRTLFRPYATEPVSITPIDAVAALNPWNRMGLDIALRVPQTVRLTGTDVQVSPGSPIGLGDINVRIGGDLYLYKDPGQPLYVTGSLDRVNGTYQFQGRQFDIDEANSSINFLGDLDPQIYVVVTREISAVLTQVTLIGSLRQPELQLASTPPLDESDVLSLIVFGTTPNTLTEVQQQELAIRAGALAAGFLAKPLLQAVQNRLGLEAFEIEPQGQTGTGPKVTIAGELAPGLIARFSRQFGQEPFDEATVEYYLSEMLRIRATFSDAQSLTTRSAFRRVERAGIDLVLFFSF